MTTDEHGDHGEHDFLRPDGDEPDDAAGEDFDESADAGGGGTFNYLLAVAMLAIPSWLVYMGVKRLFDGVFWPTWLETATTVGAALVTFYVMLRLIPRRSSDDTPEADGGDTAA